MSTVSELIGNMFTRPDYQWSDAFMRYIPQTKQHMFREYSNSVPLTMVKRLYRLIKSIDDIRSQVKSSTRTFSDSPTVITDRSTTYISLFDIKNLARALLRSVRYEWDVRIYVYIGAGFRLPSAAGSFELQPSKNNLLLSLDISELIHYLNTIRQVETVDDLPDPPVDTWLQSTEMVVMWCEFIEEFWDYTGIYKKIASVLSEAWNIYSANGANSITTLPSTPADPMLTGLARTTFTDWIDSLRIRLTDLNTRSAFGSVSYHDVTFLDLMLHVWTQKTANDPILFTRFPCADRMYVVRTYDDDDEQWFNRSAAAGRVSYNDPSDNDYYYDFVWYQSGVSQVASGSLHAPLELMYQLVSNMVTPGIMFLPYPRSFNYVFPPL